jgi:hypothetical protein
MKHSAHRREVETRAGRWPFLAILCALASLLVPGIASAGTAAGAETRIGVFDLSEQVRIRGSASLTFAPHPGCEPTYDQLASDFLLAARGGSALSKAGQALDHGGLTRAGRALEKHGSRPGSVFSRATGNVAAKNAQGQAALDDILGNVGRTSPNKFGGLDYFGGSRGGGGRFDAQGNFIGFLEP